MRCISPNVELYSEMVTTGALLHGNVKRHLQYDPSEHPVVLQLGGSEPADMAKCAEMAQDWGYDAVNINVGCPSDRVQKGSFGACLMLDAPLVAENVRAMKAAVDIPVTIKHRIGVDEQDDYESMKAFVETTAEAGCRHFVTHARKAWLQGLSPKENREKPPLMYERVYQLKQEFPELHIELNGGIETLEQVKEIQPHVDGVMIGRAAYHNPYLMAEVEQHLHGTDLPTRWAVIEAYCEYVQKQLDEGVFLKHMTRHILGMFQGQPGGRVWRRHLSENAHKPGQGVELILEALAMVKAQHDRMLNS